MSGEDCGTIHDFELGLPAGMEPAALLARAGVIEAAIRAVLNEKAENDLFNRLVIAAALDAQEADWLRAFYRYLRQSNIAFTITTVVDALAGATAGDARADRSAAHASRSRVQGRPRQGGRSGRSRYSRGSGRSGGDQ